MRSSASVSASLCSLDLNIRFIKSKHDAKKHSVVGCGIRVSCVRTGRCFSEESRSLVCVQELLCCCNLTVFNPC